MALALAATAGMSMSQARTFEYATYLPPTHPTMAFALETMFDNVRARTDGRVNMKINPSGSLVDAKGVIGALQSGLIDAGFIVPVYVPSEVPVNNVLSNTAIFMEDSVAVTGALNEMVLRHCPDCIKEYKDLGTVYLASYGTTPYHMMCNREVNKTDDLKGLKIRSAGSAYSRWITRLGATPVSMTNPETYEGLQRGQVNCMYGSLAWLKSLSIWDVAKNVYLKGAGAYGGGSLIAFNIDTWNEISADDRKTMISELPGAMARLSIGYVNQDNEAVELAKAEHNVRFAQGDSRIDALLTEHREAERQLIIDDFVKNGGDADKTAVMLDTFFDLLEKWSKISAEVGTDVDLFAQKLDEEIYSRVDINALFSN
ncbi:MAG: C4-dicarboxylate TRAP transporter substrate-binding protein [Castellaniella sp.]